MKYQKIPVEVEAKFSADGVMTPKSVFAGSQKFPIERVMYRGKHHPMEVSCLAPIKFVIIVSGQMKQLYFESSTMEWFTIKEIPD